MSKFKYGDTISFSAGFRIQEADGTVSVKSGKPRKDWTYVVMD